MTPTRSLIARAAAALCGAALAVVRPAPLHAQYAELLVSVDQLEAAAQRDSLDPMAQYDVAIGYWKSRRWDDAERALRRAIAIEPRTAVAYLALSYLPYARRPKLWKEERKGQVPPELQASVDESDRFYRRAFLIDPLVDLKIFGLMIQPAEAVTTSSYGRSLYAELTKGFIYFWDGRYEAAYQWFDRIIAYYKPKQQDKLPDYLFWYRGLAAAHLERYDVAVADFQRLLDRAVEAEKTDSIVHFTTLRANEYRYVLATIRLQAADYAAARALFQEALEHDLGLYMAHARLAELFEAQHNPVAALEERQRAIETNPEDPGLCYDLGVSQARAHRYADAAVTLAQAMEANPLNTRIPFMLGQVRLQLGDRAGAREVLERFVARAPSRFAAQAAEVREQLATLP